ncbi:hypothetical protein Landi51_13138 [Colletotrichum acutatum]
MYWHHIHKIWNTILGGREDLKQLLDVTTVRKLQCRAPGASKADRTEIKRSMLDGSLFRHVTSPSDREMIRRNVLEVTTIIPSIESFHNNMIYISIGAKILKTHLSLGKTQLDTEPPYKNNKNPLFFADVNIRRGTLFKDCLACFNNHQHPIFQVTETEFQPYEGRVSLPLAYLELFVAALRNFYPTLSSDSPLRDSRNEAVTGQLNRFHIRRFRWQAWIMGFRNRTTNAESRLEPDKEVRPKMHCSLSEWRGGKPYLRTFLDLKRHAFVGGLYRNRLATQEISPAFVFREILNAFFGDVSSYIVEQFSSYGQEYVPTTDQPVSSHWPLGEQPRSKEIPRPSTSQEQSESPRKQRAAAGTEANPQSPNDVRVGTPPKDQSSQSGTSGPELGQWEAEQRLFSIDNDDDSGDTPTIPSPTSANPTVRRPASKRRIPRQQVTSARDLVRKRKRNLDEAFGQYTTTRKRRNQRSSWDKEPIKRRRGGIKPPGYESRKTWRSEAVDLWIQLNGFPQIGEPNVEAAKSFKRKAGQALEKDSYDRDGIERPPKMRKIKTAERSIVDADFSTVELSPVEQMVDRRTPNIRPRPVESDNESARSA